MRQRLGVALALIKSPSFLILDEPMNGLDPEGIFELRKLLLKLRDEERVGVLLSSHQLSELAPICDRVLIIKQGRLLVDGSVQELLSERTTIRIAADPKERVWPILNAHGFREEHLGYELQAKSVETWVLAEEIIQAGARLHSLESVPPSLEDLYLNAASSPPKIDHPSANLGQNGKDAPTEAIAPPFALWRTLRYDLTRLSKWKFLLGATVPAAFAARAIIERALEHDQAMAALGANQLASTTVVTAFQTLGIALSAGLPVLAYLMLGFASQSVASEAAHGTLRNVLLRPLTRLDLALAKIASTLLQTFVAYGILIGVSFLVAAMFHDFEAVYEVLPNGERYEYTTASSLWGRIPQLLWEPFLPLCVLSVLGLSLGSLVRKPATALGLCLLLLVLMDGSRGFLRMSSYEGWFPAAHLPSPLGDVSSYLHYYTDLADGTGNVFWPLEGVGPLPMMLWLLVLGAVTTFSILRKSVP
jgi:ABC-type transport system involved in multi-copper enzyme maturation permease subunit